MLEHETVDADGVLTRVPLSFAYAKRWADILHYSLMGMSDQMARYTGQSPRGGKQSRYYDPLLSAYPTHLRFSTTVSTFTLYFHDEPLKHGVTCSVGMFGEPLPEDVFQEMLMAVRDLPHSAQAVEKLIERSDWLDANPMYRGLPGVAGIKEAPGQSADDAPHARPIDW